MNSASRAQALRGALAAVLVGVALGGCVSTEEKAAWAHIVDARTIASQKSTIVRRAGSEVQVTRVTLLRDTGRLAVAVALRNATSRAVNDVPISVGLRGRNGARTYLNRATGLDYFKSHVAVIPANGSVTWVFTGRRRRSVPSGRPFAVAGRESDPPITLARTIPQVRVALLKAPAAGAGGAVRVAVTNLSQIPQAELQVYALAGRAGRYLAAGSATVANLDTGHTTTTQIHLVGRPFGAQVQLEALPTLF